METVSLARDEVFPLVILGFEAPELPALRAVKTELPVFRFDHQFGGHACMHTRIVGICYRLETNLARMAPSGPELVQALRDMGESGGNWEGVTRGPALLRALWDSRGEELTETDLRELEQLFERSIPRFPRLRRGWEALVVSVPLGMPEMKAAFGGWVSSSFLRPTDVSAETPLNFWLDLAPRMADGPSCDGTTFDALREVGAALLEEAASPSAFFLWENSE